LVIDTPTRAHLPPLIDAFSSSAFLRQFQKGESDSGQVESEYVLRTVFHLCGDSVLEDPRYIDFMNNFEPDTYVSIRRDYICNKVLV
jgi:ribonuclease Z